MQIYDPFDWYWQVAGDKARWWSSKAAAYVDSLPEGAGMTNIANEAELTDVLRPYGLAGPSPTVDDVKAEARRRILEVMPEHKQVNALALFAETVQEHGSDPAKWPDEIKTLNTQMRAGWEVIKALRAKSNTIEAMSPIPVDYRDDKHWV